MIAEEPTAGAYAGRARIRLTSGRLSDAEADLTAAITIEPTNPGLFGLRANVRELLEMTEGAKADREIENKLKIEGYPRLVELNERISNDPQDCQAYHDRALIRHTRGDVVGALADLEIYIRLKDEEVHPGTYHMLATFRHSNGDFEGAIEALDTEIALLQEGGYEIAQPLRYRATLKRASGDDAGAEADEAIIRKMREQYLENRNALMKKGH